MKTEIPRSFCDETMLVSLSRSRAIAVFWYCVGCDNAMAFGLLVFRDGAVELTNAEPQHGGSTSRTSTGVRRVYHRRISEPTAAASPFGNVCLPHGSHLGWLRGHARLSVASCSLRTSAGRGVRCRWRRLLSHREPYESRRCTVLRLEQRPSMRGAFAVAMRRFSMCRKVAHRRRHRARGPGLLRRELKGAVRCAAVH